MPDLRARETGLKDQIAALDAQAADRDAYLRLAGDIEGFLAGLRQNSATATTEDRQRVLRAVVQDILIGPEKLTIRHRIPVREPASGGSHHDTTTDTEGDMRESSLLRWGRDRRSLRSSAVPLPQGAIGHLQRRFQPPLHVQQNPFLAGVRLHRLDDEIMIQGVEELLDVQINHPVALPAPLTAFSQRVMRRLPRPVPVGIRMENRFRPGLQLQGHHRLRNSVAHSGHSQNPRPAMRFRYLNRLHRRREVRTRGHPVPDLIQVTPQILLEFAHGHVIHPSGTLIGLDPPVRLLHQLLRYRERLVLLT